MHANRRRCRPRGVLEMKLYSQKHVDRKALKRARIAILVPDTAQKEFYKGIRKSLKPGAALLFAHGFNIHFRQIKPARNVDVVLIAPKGPGDLVRRQYTQGRGVPCLL